jgi:ferredoxin-NADP reductase
VRAGGTFTLAPASLQPGRPSLFVAGGIGVTPLVSMLAELTQHWRAQQLTRPEGAAPLGPRAVLIYSSRAAHEFALLPRLLDLRDEAGGLLQIRLHTSDYSPPATPGSGGSGGMGAEVSGVESSAAEEEEEEEEASRGPPPVLLQKGVRSLMRRRVTERDLRAAVGELREAALAGGSSGGKVVCYVCGPPALSDQVVAQLEADEEGVEEVVMERWW